MNIAELTEEFIEATGRVDFDDATVLKYLNRGCRFLDELLLGLQGDTKEYFTLQPESNFIISHRTVRIVTELLLYTETKQAILKQITLDEMRELYKAIPSNGEPVYFTYAPIRLVGAGGNQQQGSIQGTWANTPGNDDEAGKGILLYPPADMQYQLELVGSFYTPELRQDAQTNQWSMHHPELVIQAAIYRMDNNYRNTQAGKDLIESISMSIRSLYYDTIDADMQRSQVMGG